jgi:hypothetical protein
MALGKRKPQQDELFIPTANLRPGPGYPFYFKLNEVLGQAHFDEYVEDLCAPYYKDGDRPGIPPGIYFRMLLIGYFKGLDGQRGIAWRCAGACVDERDPPTFAGEGVRQGFCFRAEFAGSARFAAGQDGGD